ncbi:uncharacterized protein LOC123294054 [Chrysoperla carnea]|uniref:uncharacterized protein LOC123294054 n=1 Tax=Chrysoperla carnea TaxID=189513 RepID=UPI001D07DAE5|nr:uncharacterized protein LOC123294054 [Chrysoperla carnea]
MKQCTVKWFRTFLLSIVMLFLLQITYTDSVPIGNPETAVKNMHKIPQWHCLRYRKFDLYRRCRHFRSSAGMRHK